jgi:hypothetical protein
MLGGQVAETDVEICLNRLAVFLFLPNPAGVAFAQETRESRMSVCVSKRVVFAALQRRCRNHFDIGGFLCDHQRPLARNCVRRPVFVAVFATTPAATGL